MAYAQVYDRCVVCGAPLGGRRRKYCADCAADRAKAHSSMSAYRWVDEHPEVVEGACRAVAALTVEQRERLRALFSHHYQGAHYGLVTLYECEQRTNETREG